MRSLEFELSPLGTHPRIRTRSYNLRHFPHHLLGVLEIENVYDKYRENGMEEISSPSVRT